MLLIELLNENMSSSPQTKRFMFDEYVEPVRLQTATTTTTSNNHDMQRSYSIIEDVGKKLNLDLNQYNLFLLENHCEKVSVGRKLLSSMMDKVAKQLIVVLRLQDHELFVLPEGIDSILYSLGLGPLSVEKKTEKEKIKICNEKIIQAEHMICNKVCQKAKISVEKLRANAPLVHTLKKHITLMTTVNKRKSLQNSQLESGMVNILNSCVDHVRETLALDQPRRYYYVNCLLRLVNIPPLDPHLLKEKGRKIGHFKRVMESMLENFGNMVLERLDLIDLDAQSSIRCSALIFKSKAFAKYCISVSTALNQVSTNNQSKFLQRLEKRGSGVLGSGEKSSSLFVSSREVLEADNFRIPTCTEQIIINMYLSDEYSNMRPGINECVVVTEGHQKISVQKKVLLTTISELYATFKANHPGIKVGRTKFYELRPSWVVPEGNHLEANICLCIICQNCKLQACVVPGKPHYRDIISHAVCDINSPECMFGECQKCPGPDKVQYVLTKHLNDHETVSFQQWKRTKGETGVVLHQEEKTKQQFIIDFTDLLINNKPHFMLKVTQAQYLKELKCNIQSHEVIIIMDFSQNYAFTCQDAVQGFFWSNKQATVHPFAIYFKNEIQDLEVASYCVISDVRIHDATCVHAFIAKVMTHLKNRLTFSHVYYFSDGAGGQYKNCKNLSNLLYHQEDFGCTAEWHFSPTGHGKNVPDGIGGVTKRTVRMECLRRKLGEPPIQTAKEMVEYLNTRKNSNITSLYVSQADVVMHQEKFKFADRFDENNLKKAKKQLKGMKGQHQFRVVIKIIQKMIEEDMVEVFEDIDRLLKEIGDDNKKFMEEVRETRQVLNDIVVENIRLKERVKQLEGELKRALEANSNDTEFSYTDDESLIPRNLIPKKLPVFEAVKANSNDTEFDSDDESLIPKKLSALEYDSDETVFEGTR